MYKNIYKIHSDPWIQFSLAHKKLVSIINTIEETDTFGETIMETAQMYADIGNNILKTKNVDATIQAFSRNLKFPGLMAEIKEWFNSMDTDYYDLNNWEGDPKLLNKLVSAIYTFIGAYFNLL